MSNNVHYLNKYGTPNSNIKSKQNFLNRVMQIYLGM